MLWMLPSGMITWLKYSVDIVSLTIGHAAVLCQVKENIWDHLSNNSQDNTRSMYH